MKFGNPDDMRNFDVIVTPGREVREGGKEVGVVREGGGCRGGGEKWV